jgi:hypothetical protein
LRGIALGVAEKGYTRKLGNYLADELQLLRAEFREVQKDARDVAPRPSERLGKSLCDGIAL